MATDYPMAAALFEALAGYWTDDPGDTDAEVAGAALYRFLEMGDRDISDDGQAALERVLTQVADAK